MMHALLMAALAMRQVLIVNRGDDAIFNIRIGHDSSWGDDLLGFDGVIDVSQGRTVKIPLDPSTCVYNVQVTYRHGAVVVMRDIDVCKTDRLEIPGAP